MSMLDTTPARVVDCITVEGFKSIERVEELPLNPINILIGPNDAGKTNLIEAFLLLDRIHNGSLQEYVIRSGGANRILHFGSAITQEVTVGISCHECLYRYEITLASTEADGLSPLSEYGYIDHPELSGPMEVNFTPRGTEAALSRSTSIADDSSDTWNALVQLQDNWPGPFFLNASTTVPIKRLASINDNRYLRSDASNLAPFLYFLRRKEHSAYEMICRTVRLVAPFFDDFILQPHALDEDKIRLEWRHRTSDAYFDASSLSDGTLRFISLATLLLQPTRLLPSLIILDEPELGLHPYAITMLCSLVKQAATKAQIILATQSPLLLDHFEPEDGLVTERVNGRSEFNRLDRGEMEEWLKDYSLGQLWEKNEIGGRPWMERLERVPLQRES